MKTIVRKHIARILKYMVVQQLEWGRSNAIAVFLVFFLQLVSVYTSCAITVVLKTDA